MLWDRVGGETDRVHLYCSLIWIVVIVAVSIVLGRFVINKGRRMPPRNYQQRRYKQWLREERWSEQAGELQRIWILRNGCEGTVS